MARARERRQASAAYGYAGATADGETRAMYPLIKLLALPPANLVLLILAGLLIRRWALRTGTVIAIFGALALYALSTSFVGSRLLSALEGGIVPPVLAPSADGRPGAIVILSAGQAYLSPLPEPRTVDATALERLRAAVRVHRATGLPILVTGGRMPWSDAGTTGAVQQEIVCLLP